MTESIPQVVVDIEHRLRHVAGIVRRRGRRLLEQYGITPPQFDALLILHGEGELTIGELSNRLYLAYSTTTDLVDRLEAANFVVRRRGHADRRVVHVQILQAGADMIEKVLDARRYYLNQVLESVSDEEKNDILRVLDLLDAKMGV